MGFSTVPLKYAQRIGLFFSLIGMIGALFVVIKKLMNPAMVVGGASMMVGLFFFSGMILFFLGIIGEYIGKLFLNVSNFPQFVVKDVYSQGKK